MIFVSGLVNNLFPKMNIIPNVIYIQYGGGGFQCRIYAHLIVIDLEIHTKLLFSACEII